MARSKGKGSRGQGLSTRDDSLPVGKSWFLGIGINTYRSPLPALHNARKDIEDILKLLSDRYELDEAITLFDGEATRNAIMDQLQHLDEQVGQHDKLIIYYAGHGHLDNKDRGYWIPSDAQDRRIGTYLHNTTIREFIAGIEARHTLLISDSCFSGALLRDAGNTQAALEELERDRSRWVISSGRQREKVGDGVRGKNSPFAASILRVLVKNEAAGLNAGLLYDQVLKLTRFNYEQTPQSAPLFGAGHEGGQYVFRLRAGEQTIWETVKETNTIRSYNRYLTQFPRGRNTEEALAHIEALEDEKEWQKMKGIDRVFSYQTYLRIFPAGRYMAAAKSRILELEQESGPASEGKLKSFQRSMPAKQSPKEQNIFTDPRDGQIYRTVEINDLRWFAQNLNFDTGNGCWFYNNDSKMGEKYGRLYNWEAAKKACPPGWRMPTDEEWKKLQSNYTFEDLTEEGSSHFSALNGGYRNTDGNFLNLDEYGDYWTATENGWEDAWNYNFSRYNWKLNRSIYNKELGFSCRCVQD